MNLNTQAFCAAFLILCFSFSHAQTSTPLPVQEPELRTCLQLEQQGLERFNALEQRANTLRSNEKQLNERRMALQSQQKRMDKGPIEPAQISQFNQSVNVFNEQTDSFNADKEKFESESTAYQAWVSSNLQPACNKIANRPVSIVTSFFACGYDKQGEFAKLPHCTGLPNLEKLKGCVSKAGSKAKAQESCAEL